MRIGRRIAFAVAGLAPMILLQGRPDLAPRWMVQDFAGVPGVIWAAILWFGLFIGASLLPTGDGRP